MRGEKKYRYNILRVQKKNKVILISLILAHSVDFREYYQMTNTVIQLETGESSVELKTNMKDSVTNFKN